MIIQNPNEFDYCGNGLHFRYNADNYIETAGEKQSFMYEKTGVLSAGDEFLLRHPEKEASLTIFAAAKAVENLAWNEVQPGDDIYVTAQQMRDIYIINKHYEITVDGNYIIFTNREKEFVSDTASFFGFNGSGYTAEIGTHIISSGVNTAYNENHKVKGVASYWDYDNEKWVKVIELTGYANENGNCDFYFGDFLQKMAIPELPATANEGYNLLKYKVDFVEIWGEDEYSAVDSFEGYAFAGRSLDDFNIDDSNYLNYHNNNHIKIYKEQMVPLYMVLHENNDPYGYYVRGQVKLYYQNKTTREFDEEFDIMDKYSLIMQRISYDDLDMAFWEDADESTVAYFTVQFTCPSHNNKKTITFSFLPDYIDKKIIVFLNQKGFWETLAVKVNTEKEMKTDKIISKNTNNEYLEKLLDVEYSTDVSAKMDEATLVSFIESYRCGNTYLYENGAFKKITIAPDEVNTGKTTETLNQVNFKYYEEK